MYKLLLCLRYLRTRYIALASIISVMLGVATMIVVNSVMAGFSGEMKDRIHGLLADIVVQSRSMNGIYDPDAIQAEINEAAGEFIEGMTPVVEVPGLITFYLAGEPYTVPIELVGIEPEGKSLVGPMMDYLKSYQPEKRNGKIVAPPLRTRDEPLGWKLTAEALDFRRRKVEAELKFMQQDGYDVGQGPPQGPTQGGVQQASAASVPAGDEATNEVELAFSDEAPEDVPNFDDPVFPEATEEARDPREPLDARVYIGSELISVPVQNKEGGTDLKYMLRPGEDVVVGTVQSQRMEAARIEATVVDIFQSGMSEYDSRLVFMNIKELQKKRKMFRDPRFDEDGNVIDGTFAVTSVQIKLKDYADAPEVVKRLSAIFPPDKVQVVTWEEKQGPLLEAIEVEAAILNVLLFLIIAVAGFGILAIFFMIVVEKTRDIGILKALGASSRGVMSIFLSYGLALGVVGSAVGVGLGLLFVKYINEIEEGLSWITGQKVFNRQIYYFSKIPTKVSPSMVVWVAIGAMAIAVLASILPARRASRLSPVESLRYE